ILLHQVLVLVTFADVHVHDFVVFLKHGFDVRAMKRQIEDVAVIAPIGAEDDQHALVLFLFRYFEPILQQDDALADQKALEDGTVPEKLPVQVMRQKAQQAGNLKTTPQQVVTTEGSTIVIEPASTEVVYVPEYNSTVVYVEESSSSSDSGEAFAAGVAVGVLAGYEWGWASWGYSWGGYGYGYGYGVQINCSGRNSCNGNGNYNRNGNGDRNYNRNGNYNRSGNGNGDRNGNRNG